jgi:hypothetical protein
MRNWIGPPNGLDRLRMALMIAALIVFLKIVLTHHHV